MDNQHRHIKGYRDLSEQEVALMNEIKEEGARIQALLEKVNTHLASQTGEGLQREPSDEEKRRLFAAEPWRWWAMARTDLQTGLMKLVRAVAQPESF